MAQVVLGWALALPVIASSDYCAGPHGSANSHVPFPRTWYAYYRPTVLELHPIFIYFPLLRFFAPNLHDNTDVLVVCCSARSQVEFKDGANLRDHYRRGVFSISAEGGGARSIKYHQVSSKHNARCISTSYHRLATSIQSLHSPTVSLVADWCYDSV